MTERESTAMSPELRLSRSWDLEPGSWVQSLLPPERGPEKFNVTVSFAAS